ncbi:MAG: hypothetical protein L3J93_02005 [Thermoplasmata archaeon]|nr:hypothetical protein [Thermoplasmata archaeon]
MDVDAVVLNLEERDKWRTRLALLEHTLEEIRTRRGRTEARLKRIKSELRRLSEYSDAVLEHAGRSAGGRAYGPSNGHLPAR